MKMGHRVKDKRIKTLFLFYKNIHSKPVRLPVIFLFPLSGNETEDVCTAQGLI
nr:MAG TPA: hypothetical protein [Caudoviricetes sp.]